MQLCAVIIALMSVWFCGMDAKSSEPNDLFFITKRGCAKDHDQLKHCTTCFCINNRVWECQFDTCTLVNKDKNNPYSDECFIKIQHLSKGGDDEKIIKWTNSTDTIKAGEKFCLKESCTNKFVIENCPSEDSGDVFTEEEMINEDFRCQPSKSFKVSCNTCWCKASGNGAKYCTRIACNPKTYPPLHDL